MVSSNALQRTFCIQYGQNRATCFTIDIDGKQYIVTAHHILPNIGRQRVTIQIQRHRQWNDLICDVVGVAPGEIDIVVLAPPHPISPSHQLEPTMKELYLSQDVYFLGFPYGFQADVGAINADFPLPLVKKACVSMLDPAKDKTKYLFLDGHNNPGFSGGPVIFSPLGRLDSIKVAGVISGYHYTWDKVFEKNNETDLIVRYNTGIIKAYSIDYAVELIYASPIGAPVNSPNA